MLAWASVAVGFAALDPHPAAEQLRGDRFRESLFVAIPLVVLARVTARALDSDCSARVSGRRRRQRCSVFALLNLAPPRPSACRASPVLFRSASNAAVAECRATAGALDTVALYVGTGIQLVGEEVFAMLPVPRAHVLPVRQGRAVSRKTAIIVAWLISVRCGSAPRTCTTYDWNFAQAIHRDRRGATWLSPSRYIRTKNLWVSTGAHIINDWAFITVAVIGAASAAS